MPCYISGTIKITNLNLLKQAADFLGFEIKETESLINFNKNGTTIVCFSIRNKSATYNKMKNYGILQNYSERLIRLQAQRKGWDVESVKTEEKTGKLVIMLRE